LPESGHQKVRALRHVVRAGSMGAPFHPLPTAHQEERAMDIQCQDVTVQAGVVNITAIDHSDCSTRITYRIGSNPSIAEHFDHNQGTSAKSFSLTPATYHCSVVVQADYFDDSLSRRYSVSLNVNGTNVVVAIGAIADTDTSDADVGSFNITVQ
jgi:hypothetical protein